MKVTKRRLRKIIKEEIDKALKEYKTPEGDVGWHKDPTGSGLQVPAWITKQAPQPKKASWCDGSKYKMGDMCGAGTEQEYHDSIYWVDHGTAEKSSIP